MYAWKIIVDGTYIGTYRTEDRDGAVSDFFDAKYGKAHLNTPLHREILNRVDYIFAGEIYR